MESVLCWHGYKHDASRSRRNGDNAYIRVCYEGVEQEEEPSSRDKAGTAGAALIEAHRTNAGYASGGLFPEEDGSSAFMDDIILSSSLFFICLWKWDLTKQ